ncbi:MAG: hypothetical protein FWE32_03705 [Oscillospiraceae bacterium]|nr:hypothetical protein [Oscillospiraceae bacterium]
MSSQDVTELTDFAQIKTVTEAVKTILSPKQIYLYNHKLDNRGKFTSFKLCVIGDFSDKAKAERTLYWEIDSEIPFDVVLYTPGEWKDLSEITAAFASHIKETGMVLYG